MSIQEHYARPGLLESILEALRIAGKDPDRLTPQDLAPVDLFHIRGRAATLELAGAAGIHAAQHVLDLGCGIGGPSRLLATESGCRVTGLDLTAEYVRAAQALAARTGLAERVDFRQGDATQLAFADASFDAVWTEHMAMNVADKPRLYREIHRVLKPGGVLAIYDVLQGPGGEVHFPVPWARTPATSFLATPEALRRLLGEAGLAIADWNDTTEAGRAWFAALAERIGKQGLPPLGLHLLLGAEFKAMAQNQRRNLDEGRIVLAQVVAKRAPAP